jgi:hypothetical protein
MFCHQEKARDGATRGHLVQNDTVLATTISHNIEMILYINKSLVLYLVAYFEILLQFTVFLRFEKAKKEKIFKVQVSFIGQLSKGICLKVKVTVQF